MDGLQPVWHALDGKIDRREQAKDDQVGQQTNQINTAANLVGYGEMDYASVVRSLEDAAAMHILEEK